ncbi:MAG TPA: hypothetical protein VIL49_03535 [Capillimicrobium sp.]
MRLALPFFLIGLVGLLAGAAPAVACNAYGHADASRSAPGGAPLVIGDSVLLGAVPQVARRGVEVDAKGCRTFAQGLALVRQRKAAGRLPRVVALALGTNGTVSRAEIGAAMRVLGSRRLLVLVTPREVGGVSGSDAAAMRRAARRHPGRVRVLDWVRRSSGRGSWFAGDGIHLGSPGARGMARLLDALPAMGARLRAKARR